MTAITFGRAGWKCEAIETSHAKQSVADSVSRKLNVGASQSTLKSISDKPSA